MNTEELVYIHEIKGSVGIKTCFPVSKHGFGKVFEVKCTDIPYLRTYCDALVKGILLGKGLSINQVVFQPPDSPDKQFIGEKGEPVTVFRITSDRREDYYEFHVFFDTKASTIRHGILDKDWR